MTHSHFKKENFHLNQIGFTDFYQTEWASLQVDHPEWSVARITEVHKEQYGIVSEYGEQRARLKASIFYNKVGMIYPTVGDFVCIQYNKDGDSIIHHVLKRKSLFSRLDSSADKEQTVAANFDYVFLMTSLNQDFNLKRMERYLAQSWQSGGSPVIVLTKADLCSDIDSYVDALETIAFGVPIVVISAINREGLEGLSPYLQPRKSVVFLGSSGVGKSSLVNALSEEVVMDTGGIRETDARGKHTTTYRQMIYLHTGAMVIDTPGMRELGLWGSDESLGISFEDIERLIGSCQFSDCSHGEEKGCAVQAALKNGQLEASRWQRYLKLMRELRFSRNKERRSERLKNKMEKPSSKVARAQAKSAVAQGIMED